MDAKGIVQQFRNLYNKAPLVVRSPGRINLIGEHTDYNQGLVLPAAIDKEIILALAANGSDSCHIYASDVSQQVEFSLNDLSRSSQEWANYIIGVVRQIVDSGYVVKGFDCVFGGDIPIGAGLSSSAALECGVAFGLNEMWDLGIGKLEIARLAMQAENNFVGVNCGLMDQYANMFGKAGQLIQLDCRTMEHKNIEVDLQGHSLWLFNSNVEHQLGDSEYNVRRAECEKGLRQLKMSYPRIQSLRDCQLPMLEALSARESSKLYQRCRYVIEENSRVIEGSKDLQQGDLRKFGAKMYACHEGLSKMYEVSCPELDLLVDYTKNEAGVIGARMMGGGFGGCSINLVMNQEVDGLVDRISLQYKAATGMEMTPYSVSISDGTSLVH